MVYALLVILIHTISAGILVSFGLLLSVETLGLVAGLLFLFIFSAIGVTYFRNFGTEPIGFVRTGEVGLDRPDVLLAAMAAIGYLVLILVLGPRFAPEAFLWSFMGFWFLFVVFLVVLVFAAKNIRKKAATNARR